MELSICTLQEAQKKRERNSLRLLYTIATYLKFSSFYYYAKIDYFLPNSANYTHLSLLADTGHNI